MKKRGFFLLLLILFSCVLPVSAVSQNITMNMSSQSLSQSSFNAFSAKVYNQTWLDFNGINNSILIPNKNYLSPAYNQNTTTFLISFVIKENSGGDFSDGRRYLFSKGAINDYEYELAISNSTSRSIYFMEFSKDGSSSNTLNVVTNYTTNQLYNIIICFNGTKITGYVNGNSLYSLGISKLWGNGSANLLIAKRDTTSYLNASVYEFEILNQTLAPLQARELYQNSKAGSNLTYIPVLMHHNVGNPADSGNNVNETQLRQELDFLNTSGYKTITDREYYNWTQNQGFVMPARPIIFIWDDGYISIINNASRIMAEYGYKGVSAIITSSVGFGGFMSWENISKLINFYNWSIASHSDTHCSMAGTTWGSCISNCLCNTTDTLQGNLSLSKSKIIVNTNFTPITFIHPYNDWNVSTMNNCSLNYSLCFGFGYSPDKAEYINKNSGTYNGDLRRISILNTTTISELNNALNFTLSLNKLLYYKFNENNGTIVYDTSGNVLNGTISGATWNNDNVLLTLAESIDYTVDRTLGIFTLLNTAYKYAFGLLSMCTETWTCSSWSACFSGTQTRTCTDANSCGTTMTKPIVSQSCVVSGTAEVTTTPPVPVSPNVPVEVNINNSNLDLTKITINVLQAISNFSLNVTKVDIVQTEAGLPIGQPYQAFRIDTITSDSSISNATINFKVNKTWLSSKNGVFNDVSLYRKPTASTQWFHLATTLVNNDSNYYYFSSLSPGFSTFAIFLGKYECQQGDKRCLDNGVQLCLSNSTWAVADKCNFGCDNGECKEISLSFILYISIIAVVSLAIIFVLYSLFRKRKREK